MLKNLNLSKELYNGSRGVIIGFEEEGKHKGFPIVKFSNGIVHTISRDEWKYEIGGTVMAARYQVPLVLSYALVYLCNFNILKYILSSLYIKVRE